MSKATEKGQQFERINLNLTKEQSAMLYGIMDDDEFTKFSTWIRDQVIRTYVERRGKEFPASVKAGGYRPKSKENENVEQD